MSSIELTSLENANKNELIGLDFLQTSCIKCRFEPDYLSAIPFFKKAADLYHGCGKFDEEINSRSKLVRCFRTTKSYWEEGNEHEKVFKVQLHQLQKYHEAYITIVNAYHAYCANKSYEYAIKALTKGSEEFFDLKQSEFTLKTLKLAYEGIDKFYHLLTFNEKDNTMYIYECVDKYIDILAHLKDFESINNTCKSFIELIKNNCKEEKFNEMSEVAKYYGASAVAYFLNGNEGEYRNIIEEGKSIRTKDNICHVVERLFYVIRQRKKENNKLIKKIFDDISDVYPSGLNKLINQYILDNKPSEDSNIISTSIESDDFK